MDEEKSGLVEWTIENFGCYCRELHGDHIESHLFNYSSRFQLTPDGPGGHMEVEVKSGPRKKKPRANPGELTFLGSDGQPLHTQLVDCSDPLLDPPPTFEEVLTLIREREPTYPDQLTIRYRFPSNKSFVEHMSTSLEVVETDFRVDVDVANGNARIADMDYSAARLPSRLHLNSVRKGNSVEITLEPSNFKSYCLVECYINFLEEDGRCKVTDHMFRDEAPWTILDPQDMGERKVLPVHLRIKIVTGAVVKKSFRRMHNCREGDPDSTLNTSLCSESEISTSSAVEPPHPNYDLFLRCGSVTFASQRKVLSAWSPVFERLLSSDMAEAASGVVEISDLDPPTLARFLDFLHTATVEDLTPDSAIKLYYAADKYDLGSLKRECSDHLVRTLSVATVCEVLSLGSKHSEVELVSAAQNFILNNFNEVLASGEWRAFKGTEPLLAVNTITSFAERNCLGRIDTATKVEFPSDS